MIAKSRQTAKGSPHLPWLARRRGSEILSETERDESFDLCATTEMEMILPGLPSRYSGHAGQRQT
jgi:hypothetical protein